METLYDVAIIGAGTAGLSAYQEVKKVTQNLVVINGGHYGTTCARVGCMPSKVLIQVANDFHRRHKFPSLGIEGGEHLTLDRKKAMEHVRQLRDRFVRSTMGTIEEIGDRNIKGYAKFVEPGVLDVEGKMIRAKVIVLATGSRPVIPKAFESFRDRVLTSDEIFEEPDFPQNMAVLGTGVIGMELGQALHRMGIEVFGVGRSGFIAGLTDPQVNEYAVSAIKEEFPLWFGNDLKVEPSGEKLKVSCGRFSQDVDKIFLSLGRRPNSTEMDLEKAGIELDERGVPKFDRQTMQVGNLPLFIAGDLNAEATILHEAADEGRIAGYNAVRVGVTQKFRRRVPLEIAFCDPNCVKVGSSFRQLTEGTFEVGEVSFEGQGRSLVMSKNKGVLKVYGDKRTGRLLGAEMMAPSGEHLGHLLSWAIEKEMTVTEALRMPFYHPVVEEGLRTALRELARKIQDSPETPELGRL